MARAPSERPLRSIDDHDIPAAANEGRQRWRGPDSTSPPLTTLPSRGGDAVAEGRLLAHALLDLRRGALLPPALLPPLRGRHTVSWEEASGNATLYTWSVVHQNDLPPFNERVPYVVAAVVDLVEGPPHDDQRRGVRVRRVRRGHGVARGRSPTSATEYHVPVVPPAGAVAGGGQCRDQRGKSGNSSPEEAGGSAGRCRAGTGRRRFRRGDQLPPRRRCGRRYGRRPSRRWARRPRATRPRSSPPPRTRPWWRRCSRTSAPSTPSCTRRASPAAATPWPTPTRPSSSASWPSTRSAPITCAGSSSRPCGRGPGGDVVFVSSVAATDPRPQQRALQHGHRRGARGPGRDLRQGGAPSWAST